MVHLLRQYTWYLLLLSILDCDASSYRIYKSVVWIISNSDILKQMQHNHWNMLASYGTACSTGNTALMAMNRSRSCHLLGWADDCICDVNLEKTLPCISFDRRLTRGELGTAVSDELLVSELLLESHRQTPACTQWSTQTAACTQLWTITAVHT